MRTTFEEIINMLNKRVPDDYAEIWDNIGAMLGNKTQEISKVLLCLDVTNSVVNEAIEGNYNLIISHHPFLFDPMKKIIENDHKGSLVYSLIKNNIAVYSAHTNLDAVRGGVNSALSEKIGLTDVRPFYNNNDSDYANKISDATNEDEAVYLGLAVKGSVEECTLKDFAAGVKEKLNLPVVKYIGDPEKPVKTVGVFCGSFSGSSNEVLQSGVDVVVTGELKHNYAIEFVDNKTGLIEAGHYRTENVVLPALAKTIRTAFPQLEVVVSVSERDPYSYLV